MREAGGQGEGPQYQSLVQFWPHRCPNAKRSPEQLTCSILLTALKSGLDYHRTAGPTRDEARGLSSTFSTFKWACAETEVVFRISSLHVCHTSA